MEAALLGLQRGERAGVARWLRDHLTGQVLAFWEPLWQESEYGLSTCVDDAGRVVADDRWLWSQWRAVWVCARLHQTIDGSGIWLERARRVAEFCLAHGWLEEAQGWALVLGPDGAVRRGHESVYVDAFAVYGLSELAAATGESRWLDWARRTADASLCRLKQEPSTWPHFPYPIPAGHQPHGVPMIWSLKLAVLAAVSQEAKYATAALDFADQVWRDFYDGGEDRVRETVRIGGGLGRGLAGEVTVPGHVIEGMWFQRLVRQGLVGDHGASMQARIWSTTRRHFALGWDEAQGGGLLLAVDGQGRPVAEEAWGFASSKLWWPQTEGLFASLHAWHDTSEAEWLDRYAAWWRLCLEHYVDWEHGEWRQKLQRDLSPFTGTVALPVKDPFHLPRSLILQIELLEKKQPPPLVGSGC